MQNDTVNVTIGLFQAKENAKPYGHICVRKCVMTLENVTFSEADQHVEQMNKMLGHKFEDGVSFKVKEDDYFFMFWD